MSVTDNGDSSNEGERKNESSAQEAQNLLKLLI